MNFKGMTRDRFRGSMLGLACGDALGTTVEFMIRGCFEPLTTIVGGGPFGLKAGEWTDDTSMALSLAESLLSNEGMNLTDQLERYTFWWKHGENSVTGECFDIGNTVKGALINYVKTGEQYSGSTDPSSAGNGSIMRLAPVPLFYSSEALPAVMKQCAESSRTTHGAAEAVHACELLGALICSALRAVDKETVLKLGEDFLKYVPDSSSQIQEIAQQAYIDKEVSEIRGSGYVVRSLEAALWCFFHSDSFEEGALKAVNLGDDADTTGAVYGQIAGAFYGESGIPRSWLDVLAWRKKITLLADKIYEHATKH